MTNPTSDISRYKKLLREKRISHQQVADHIGCTREHVTVLLNGRSLPAKKAQHISHEIEELLNS